MSKAFIVDASVAVAWVHPGQATAETKALLADLAAGAVMEAPALWPVETANALLVLTRRGKLSEQQRKLALYFLSQLPIKLDHEMAGLALTTLSDLAATHSLSVYDAAYLELAQRRQLPLACKDGPLRIAAKATGIDLLGFYVP